MKNTISQIKDCRFENHVSVKVYYQTIYIFTNRTNFRFYGVWNVLDLGVLVLFICLDVVLYVD